MVLTVDGRSVDSTLGSVSSLPALAPSQASIPPPTWKLGAHGWVAPQGTELHLRACCAQRRPLGAPSHWGRLQRRKEALDCAHRLPRQDTSPNWYSTEVGWRPRPIAPRPSVQRSIAQDGDEMDHDALSYSESYAYSSDVFTRTAKSSFGQSREEFVKTFHGSDHPQSLHLSDTAREGFRLGGGPPTLLQLQVNQFKLSKQPAPGAVETKMRGGLNPLSVNSPLSPITDTGDIKPKSEVRLPRGAPGHWRWKQLRPASLGLVRNNASAPVGIVLDHAHDVPAAPRKLAPSTKENTRFL